MKSRTRSFSAKMLAMVAVLAAGAMVSTDFAEARVGGGGSSGSRGSRTFSSGPATNTAPRAAQPIQNSISKPGAVSNAAQATRSGGLVRNLLLGGLIGAGLATLFGAGAFANVLGFLLQGALIAGVVMLAISFFRGRGRNQPALATAGASASRGNGTDNAYRASVASVGGSQPELQIAPDDFNSFERLLKEIQLAYTNNDLKALETRTTPEMLSNLAGELDANKRKGVSNDLSEPKLLQGDLAESWREAGGEYATVDLRYEIIDATVDQKSGRVVSGSTTEPQQVVERWTFWRPAGGSARQWELSAIQQV